MTYLRPNDEMGEFPIYDQSAREFRTFLVPRRRTNRVGRVINRKDHQKPRVEAMENIALAIEPGDRIGQIGGGSGGGDGLYCRADIFYNSISNAGSLWARWAEFF